MSRSPLSFASATLLLAAGALATGADDYDAVGAAAGPPASAAPSSHIVRVDVVAQGGAPKALDGVMVQPRGPDPQAVLVGSQGALLNLPGANAIELDVLFPHGRCGAILSPKAIASGRVTIVVDLSNGMDRAHCSVVIPATAASAATPAS